MEFFLKPFKLKATWLQNAQDKHVPLRYNISKTINSDVISRGHAFDKSIFRECLKQKNIRSIG